MTYISSQSLTSTLQWSVLQSQAALAQAQTEISTGVVADLGLTLGARTGLSLSLKSQTDQLNAYTSTNDLANTRLSATSSALDSILSSAQSMASSALAASSAGGSTSAITSSAQAALQALISGLNTSSGGQYVFGGINSTSQPISDYLSSTTSSAKQAVDAAFQSAFGTSQTSASASSISGTAMQSFLDNQFGALFTGSSWQSDWSTASSTTFQSQIGPSQSATTSVSANQTAFQQLSEAYTMLTEFTGQNLSDDARAAVVSTASSLIGTATSALTNIQSGVGVAQAAISSANDQITAQVGILTTSANDLESVDTYALSSKVTTLQTQLEASYELTSRLQQLSLVNYLTG